MNHKSKIIFISWASHHSHTQQLGDALGAEIFYIENLINSRGILWKIFFLIDYISKAFRTIKIIFKNKPKIVFVQNPPSFAIIVIVFVSFFKNIKTVSDTHNGAFEKPWISVPLHKWALKKSDLVIIHNNQLLNEIKNDLKLESVNFKVLNSRLTDFSGIKKELQQTPYFLVVSTFHGDEPMDILLEGIRKYNEKNSTGIKFKITGNYKKKPALYSEYQADENIEFLGFVEQSLYNYLIVNAYGVISLSTRDRVQQFSIMEAVGAEVPFISTNNLTNRELFDDRMILTHNNPVDISESITRFVVNIENLQKNIFEIKQELGKKWEKDFNSVNGALLFNEIIKI